MYRVIVEPSWTEKGYQDYSVERIFKTLELAQAFCDENNTEEYLDEYQPLKPEKALGIVECHNALMGHLSFWYGIKQSDYIK